LRFEELIAWQKARLMTREMVKQRWEPMGIISSGPGWYEGQYMQALGKHGDDVGTFLAQTIGMDDFIRSVGQTLQPNTSALFVLSSDAVLDKVRDAFAGASPELIHTT
jgi:hypothetical protein